MIRGGGNVKRLAPVLFAIAFAVPAQAIVIHRHFGRAGVGFGANASVDCPVDWRVAQALDDAGRREAERKLTVIGNVLSVSPGGLVTIRPNGGFATLVRPAHVLIPADGERYSADSAHHLEKLIGQKRISLEYRPAERRGIRTGVMRCGKADVALRMIRDGYARAGADAPDSYRAAERSARAAERGIWAPPLVIPLPPAAKPVSAPASKPAAVNPPVLPR